MDALYGQSQHVGHRTRLPGVDQASGTRASFGGRFIRLPPVGATSGYPAVMSSSTGAQARSRRRPALIGLAGAILTGIGDVLILGRPSSGSDFDQAAGIVPPHIDADHRWRSMWNGAVLSPGRVHLGTISGLVGIGLLEWLSLRGISRAIHPGTHRRVAEGSATAFAAVGIIGRVPTLDSSGNDDGLVIAAI